MKIKIVFLLVLFLLSVLLIAEQRRSFSAVEQKRIRFQVVTVEEKSGERNILSQTTIEGLPGTDFSINLQTGSFKMQAQFLSDLIESDKLKIRTRLNTRRFYGYSPVNLPLYEEDAQSQTLHVGFDETIVLLPFGRGGAAAETLKIEITPALLVVKDAATAGAKSSDKLEIKFDKPLQSGEIFVEASKVPHNFEVDAVLLADGKEVARTSKNVLLEEEGEIVLNIDERAGLEISDQPLTAKLTVSKFTRSRPENTAAIDYKIYRAQGDAAKQTEILRGAGIVGLGGGNLIYELDKRLLPGNKKYELKFSVRLAPGERGGE